MNADTECNLGNIARSVLRRTVFCFSDDDVVVVKRAHPNIRVVYFPAGASGGPSDLTTMELCFRGDTEEMWIGSLRVAVPFRSMGLGRELVQAAEEIARATGVAVVNAFPLYRSRAFWLKMGYRPLGLTSRVLSRYVRPGATVQEFAEAPACWRSRMAEAIGTGGAAFGSSEQSHL